MKKIFFFFLFIITGGKIFCQQIPLNAAVQNRLNEISLNADTSIFTGFRSINWLEVKPFLSKVKTDITDSIFGIAPTAGGSYFFQNVSTDNLVKVSGKTHTLAVDPYIDAAAGSSSVNTGLLLQTSAGVNIQGVCNNRLSYTFGFISGFNQFPAYINSYIDSNQHYMPGMGKGTPKTSGGFTNTQFYGNVTYQTGKHLLFAAGYGKNFVGDGYRSLILSDNSASYPYVRMQAKLWKFTYNVLYTEYFNPRYIVDGNDQRKYSVLHYLGINLSSKFQLGLFDDIVWLAKDTNNHRGFDFQYLSPLIFLHPVNLALGSPDNALLGLTYKYKFYKHGFLYGQINLDDLHIKDSRLANKQSSGNKYALQVGIWNQDIFNVKNLSYRFEWNGVRPYTYSHGLGNFGLNYTNKNQALADPFNANFHEFISIFNYHNMRWYGSLENLFAIRGENPGVPYNNGEDLWGGDIGIPPFGVKTLAGAKNKYLYNQFTAGYLLNPKNRLSLQADIVYRKHTAPQISQSEFYFSFGIKTNLFNYYHDF